MGIVGITKEVSMGMEHRTVPMIVQCGHCGGAQGLYEQRLDKAPLLYFGNFPTAGVLILTKKTWVLACRECSRDVRRVDDMVDAATAVG